MPHLRFEYPAALAPLADPAALAETLRATLAATGLYPPAGIRVRGFAADAAAAFGGAPGGLWLDMVLRIGAGRTAADKARTCDALYAAARGFLEPRLAPRPFALSLELTEIDPAFSRKAWNTHRAAPGT